MSYVLVLFAQLLASNLTALTSSATASLTQWIHACAARDSASSVLPEVVLQALPPDGVADWSDVSSVGETRLSPLSTLIAGYALFEHSSQGYKAACGVLSHAVRVLKGVATAFAKARSSALRREDVDAAITSLNTTLAQAGSTSSNLWTTAYASIGKRSASLITDSLAQSAVFTDAWAETYPVDTSDGIGCIVDYLLFNTEWLYCWWVQLTRHHASRSSLAPRIQRHLLEEALSTFPANAMLLSLYTTPHRHVLHTGVRIRQFVERFTTHPNCSVIVWAQLLHAEITHSSSSSSSSPSSEPSDASLGSDSHSDAMFTSVHSIRRLFESALGSVVGQRSPLLWRMYLRFELVTGNALNARKVWFRAVNQCPGVKSVWTDCVRRLRPYLTSDELVDLLRVMVEKGIRLRSPLKLKA